MKPAAVLVAGFVALRRDPPRSLLARKIDLRLQRTSIDPVVRPVGAVP